MEVALLVVWPSHFPGSVHMYVNHLVVTVSCRSVLGSVAEGGAASTPGSFSDIMQSPVSSSKPVQVNLTSEHDVCIV